MSKVTGRFLLSLAVLLLASGGALAAADLEREQRLAEQIVDAILDGEPVYLEAQEHRFLGIYTESFSDPAGRAVLILHGRGYHPDWAQVVQPLRVGLAEQGWNTLSIQLPVLHKEAKFYDYVPLFAEATPRINAAIRYLKEQGNETIAMIAHSCGVHMSMAWVRENGDSDIDAYIGIGMGATDYKQPMREPLPLDTMTVPVLDLYGAMDYPAVQGAAPDRRAAVKAAGNPKSSQQVLEYADHYMSDQDEALLEAVSGWLQRALPAP